MVSRLRTHNRRAKQRRRVMRANWVHWLKHELWMRKRSKREGGISEGTVRWYLYRATDNEKYLT